MLEHSLYTKKLEAFILCKYAFTLCRERIQVRVEPLFIDSKILSDNLLSHAVLEQLLFGYHSVVVGIQYLKNVLCDVLVVFTQHNLLQAVFLL